MAFILCSLAGLSTLIGFLLVFFKTNNKNFIICNSMSFAMGVMLTVSFVDLIPETIKLFNESFSIIIAILFTILSFTIGYIISSLLDKAIPNNFNTNNNKLFKIGIVTMLGIIIHNIPEGMATFITSNNNLNIGLTLTIAIALHNIPEGISIAIPIYYSTNSKLKAFIYTFISALSEPLGALMAFTFFKTISSSLLAIILGIIAGIMTQISLCELLPTAIQYKRKKIPFIFFLSGIIIMISTIYLLNTI